MRSIRRFPIHRIFRLLAVSCVFGFTCTHHLGGGLTIVEAAFRPMSFSLSRRIAPTLCPPRLLSPSMGSTHQRRCKTLTSRNSADDDSPRTSLLSINTNGIPSSKIPLTRRSSIVHALILVNLVIFVAEKVFQFPLRNNLFLLLLFGRSVQAILGGGNSEDSPPWNPSSHIDKDGFLRDNYERCPGEWEEEANIGGRHGPRSRRYKQLETVPVKIRQVPGDGNCLFHSIATCLSYAVRGNHVCMKDTTDLRKQSQDLRQRAVDKLESREKLLYVQGHEYLRAKDLVDAVAASQFGLSGEHYCELMRQDSIWGGGPEIVALCNALRRPIHVYELYSHRKQFLLRRMACFGSPKFDRREPLHILSADSRFPDVSPGKQHDSGNHFLAVFPESHRVARKAGVRGGDNHLICRGESHARWKFATWIAVWWSTFSGFWKRPK